MPDSPAPADLDQQLAAAVRGFANAFGRPPTLAAVAPGRVNLIGEHTDYNQGFVLPMAIERQSIIVADRRRDRVARLRSADIPGEATFEVGLGISPGNPPWSNYLRGVVAEYLNHGLEVGGFDALLSSTVPAGGGLSSSASIEVATATLMESLAQHPLEPIAKALLCQQAEHRYAGVPCGIMDQFISAMGEAGSALLIDCRDHRTQLVSMDDTSVAVLIVNSNVKHELSGGEYAQRRAQCEAAARALGVEALRDADVDQLEAKRSDLEPLAYRRARHVITENQRTLGAVESLSRRDWSAVGKAMNESHASLRDDFEVSTPELDTLVELAMRRPSSEVFGSRMTGGGFGGCTVTLVKANQANEVADSITQGYRQATGIEPTAFVTRPAAGARPLSLA